MKKAGSTIRRFIRGVDGVTMEDYARALEVMEAWRASHTLPLATASMGVRSRVRTLGLDAKVTQRLKRRSTILEKLSERETTLDFSRMQDIGGCRAVLNTPTELRRLQDRLCNGRVTILRVDDYIEAPRQSGYRAVHIVAEFRGRPIEVQLRTTAMHAWAQSVEEWSGRLGCNFKQDGGHPVQLLYAEISSVQALLEAGLSAPTDLVLRLEAARLAAQPCLEGRMS